MLGTDEKKVYASLTTLRGNPDFETVMSWVEVERERVKEMLTRCSSDRFGILQGEANAYGAILKAHKEAPEVLKRLNTK